MTITPVDSVVTALAWGGVTAAGIMAGALLGIFARLTHGTIARSMSLGAGLLLLGRVGGGGAQGRAI